MRLAAALLLALAACHHAGSPADPDGGTPDGGHPTPGPGIAAAWKITDAKDLIGGPNTAGKVGDWILANSKIRVIVEDARPSDGYDPYGCSVAAADRVRPAGTPGESRFGEIWLGLNFRAAGCDQVQLVNDGSDGEAAVIRGVGTDEVQPFMASIFAQGLEPAPLHATIFREYSLAPDTDAVMLNLTIRNDGTSELDINKAYVGMAMNRGLRHWIDHSGFDFDLTADAVRNLNASAEFYAAVGDRVSYSVLNLDTAFSPIINFAHVLIGQYPETRIPAGQAKTYRFALAVGSGDVGSLQIAHREVSAAQGDVLDLKGTVVDPQGQPVAHARVHVSNTAGDQVFSYALTASDGTFNAPVRAGTYALRALADDRTGSSVQTVTVPAAPVTLQVGAPATLHVTTGGLPSKIVLEPNNTVRPSLPAAFGEMWSRQPLVVFSPNGTADLSVFPSTWTVTVSRGFEYDLFKQDVPLTAGSSATVSASLHRVVDTTGWVSGDYHIHAQRSPDGDDLVDLKVRAFAAEGVEIPVSTEHEYIGDFGPSVAAQNLGAFMHTMPGTEMTTTYVGHFNIFPLVPQPLMQNAGAFNWYERNLPDVFAEARQRGAPIIQMNHPRASQMGYLDSVGFDPSSFGPTVNVAHWSATWDAMEIWNGEALRIFEGCPGGEAWCVAPSHPQMKDWFSFLNHGQRVTGMGNSDSHNASLRETGYPRTYLALPGDDPAQITDAQVVAAIRSGAAVISGGPFLMTSVNGVSPVGPGGTYVDTTGTGAIPLTITLQAPTWMGPMARIDVYVGGALAKTITLTDPATQVARYSNTITVNVTGNTFIVVTARGVVDANGSSSALWPVVQEPVPPYAITNPIWIQTAP